MDLIELYSKKKLKNVFRMVAHMVGIWEPVDYVRLGRRLQRAKGIKKVWLQIKYLKLGCRLRIDIPNFNNIGKNFTLVHASSVVIHEDAIIGESCSVYKGVSIGSIRSGKRAGTPVIEDRVVIHANSVVAGGITIGHDTLIAADTFVDFDVPPHSVVIGNPATIHQKQNASRDYIVTAE